MRISSPCCGDAKTGPLGGGRIDRRSVEMLAKGYASESKEKRSSLGFRIVDPENLLHIKFPTRLGMAAGAFGVYIAMYW